MIAQRALISVAKNGPGAVFAGPAGTLASA
jgi:hypothetical protein